MSYCREVFLLPDYPTYLSSSLKLWGVLQGSALSLDRNSTLPSSSLTWGCLSCPKKKPGFSHLLCPHPLS